jgi:hypothetical protein
MHFLASIKWKSRYFARIIAKCAYAHGAKRVTVLWHDDKLSKISYTNESIDINTSIFINNGDDYAEFPIVNKVLNKDIKPSDIVNEFVFNINSPANIIFNEEIKWNNDNAPDLTKTGIYTISILNGVGCYTFVNS